MKKGYEKVRFRCGKEIVLQNVSRRTKGDSAAVAVRLRKVEFRGSGEDTAQAIASLARELPEECRIEACISCKYGSFCPIGDVDDEIFCLRDVCPRDKNDVLHYTLNEFESEKRKRRLLDVCEGYEPLCSDADRYTYNSFMADADKGQ